MPAKKKGKKRPKSTPVRRRGNATVKKTSAKKKTAKRTATKTASGLKGGRGRKTATAETGGSGTKQSQDSSQNVYKVRSTRGTGEAKFSGRQSGDLQGISRSEQDDSESVDELIEEGNAFEADAIAGVQEADESDEKEVRTHEVPEDDVPGEYLEKD